MTDQKGITLFTSLVILSLVVVLSSAIASLVLRTSQTSTQIGISEQAYYAAETAIEKALYLIEKGRTVAGVTTSGSLTSITDASWERDYSQVLTVDTKCSDLGSTEGMCLNDPTEEMGSSNPLFVNLDPGSSFQLDLDFEDFLTANNILLTWQGDGKLITIGNDGLNTYQNSPVTINNIETNLFVIRLVNTDDSAVTFRFLPSGDGLPLGILLSATGSYKGQSRTIEVERKNWQIY